MVKRAIRAGLLLAAITIAGVANAAPHGPDTKIETLKKDAPAASPSPADKTWRTRTAPVPPPPALPRSLRIA